MAKSRSPRREGEKNEKYKKGGEKGHEKGVSVSGEKGVSVSGEEEDEKGVSVSGEKEKNEKGVSVSGEKENEKGVSVSGECEPHKLTWAQSRFLQLQSAIALNRMAGRFEWARELEEELEKLNTADDNDNANAESK